MNVAEAVAVIESAARERARAEFVEARRAMLDAIREADKAEFGSLECSIAWLRAMELAGKPAFEAGREWKRRNRTRGGR